MEYLQDAATPSPEQKLRLSDASSTARGLEAACAAAEESAGLKRQLFGAKSKVIPQIQAAGQNLLRGYGCYNEQTVCPAKLEFHG